MKLDNSMRARLEKLATTNISDALDSLGLKGSTWGIRPIFQGAGKIIGPAVTVKIIPAGQTKSRNHLGVQAIEAAESGDVVVIDNGGRIDTACWGGILANGALQKGISGVVIDGACRDVDDYVEIGFSVYARGAVVHTARNRIMEEATNVLVQFGGVQVRPGDIVVGDLSGVVIIPVEHLEEVTGLAEKFLEKEERMISAIRAGRSILEVDNEFRYETMLEKKEE